VTDPRNAVFLSYASQDVAVALQLCNARRQSGIEAWLDQSELRYARLRSSASQSLRTKRLPQRRWRSTPRTNTEKSVRCAGRQTLLP
jgi:hypothetical protein